MLSSRSRAMRGVNSFLTRCCLSSVDLNRSEWWCSNCLRSVSKFSCDERIRSFSWLQTVFANLVIRSERVDRSNRVEKEIYFVSLRFSRTFIATERLKSGSMRGELFQATVRKSYETRQFEANGTTETRRTSFILWIKTLNRFELVGKVTLTW